MTFYWVEVNGIKTIGLKYGKYLDGQDSWICLTSLGTIKRPESEVKVLSEVKDESELSAESLIDEARLEDEIEALKKDKEIWSDLIKNQEERLESLKKENERLIEENKTLKAMPYWSKPDKTTLIMKAIDDYQNPYPKDIFDWNNKEKLDFNRGRFNRHCFEIVENVRSDFKSKIKNILEGYE